MRRSISAVVLPLLLGACSEQVTDAPIDSTKGSLHGGAGWPIVSLTNLDDFGDLTFLGPLLEGSRIVQLGESGHGVAEFNEAKVRLIKYMHERLGYDVMAFESGLWDCHVAETRATQLRADSIMRGCIFGVWHTYEVLPLFEYIKETRKTSRPLILAGFDTQPSTLTTSIRLRPAALRAALTPYNAGLAARVHDMDSSFVFGGVEGWDPYVATHGELWMRAKYDSAAAIIAAHRSDIDKLSSFPRYGSLLEQSARSAAEFIRQAATADIATGSFIRDKGMADNVTFLANTLYSDKKIIVWAHNAHIRHWSESATAAQGTANMGYWLYQRHAPELYTVGLYMDNGSAADNARRVYSIAPAAAGTMESTVRLNDTPVQFFDLSKTRTISTTSWADSLISFREWGRNTSRAKFRAEYDAILFINTVRAPAYLPR